MYENAEYLCTGLSVSQASISQEREGLAHKTKDLIGDSPLPQSNIQSGETVLTRAAKDNSSEMVENLLKHRADPNRQDKVH